MTPGASRILIAEDSRLVAATVCDALSADGHAVITVRDGTAVLQVLEREAVDVVLTDGDMPRMGGLEVCRAIRARDGLRGLPIIFMTASGVNPAEALDAGADDYVRKPCEPDELRARVRAALRIGRLQREVGAERDMSLALVDSLQDGLLVAAADGAIVRVNDRLGQITGFTQEELVGSRPPYPFWPGESALAWERQLEKALRGELAGEADRVYQRPDGSRRQVIVSLAPASVAGMRGRLFVATVKDITARREAEQELRASEARAREMAREQGALGRVAAAVAGGNDPDQVFDLATREVAGLFHVEAGGLSQFLPNDQAILVGSWASVDAMRLTKGARLSTNDDSMTGRVRRTGQPTRALEGAHRGDGHVERRSGIAAPVWVDGELWGVLGALSHRADAFPDDAEQRITKFSPLVGLAIASADARRRLEQQALTDPLTGLLNRRAFEQRLTEEVRRAQRTGAPLSVCMIDLDHFKQVNDEHGHEAGDALLQAMASRMRRSCRQTDVIARIGGEEFVWLLPATPIDGAATLAERLRVSIAEQPFEIVGLRTISAGLAQLEPDDHDGRLLLRTADTRLYAAKTTGRNRIAA